jgi:hypothetical protein
MTPLKDETQERLSRLHQRTYRMSAKLLAWAFLLERQSECEGLIELEGLGVSLRQYGQQLRKVSYSIDQIEVELESKGGQK